MEAVEKSSLLLCWLCSAGIPAGSGAPSAQWAGKRQETGGWPYVCAKESEGNGEEQEWSGGTHQKVRHPPASKFTTIAQVLLIELIDLIFTSLIDLVETSRGCVSTSLILHNKISIWGIYTGQPSGLQGCSTVFLLSGCVQAQGWWYQVQELLSCDSL